MTRRSSMLLMAIAVIVIIGAGTTAVSASVLLPDRGTLDRLLGSGALRENFERFPIDDFAAMGLDVTALDTSTIANGYGPGLIVPGVTVRSAGLQWNGRGYFGQPSRNLSGERSLEVDFDTPADAVGVDLRVFSHFPDVAEISVFGADDTTLLGIVTLTILDPSFEVFFGFADASGIGRLEITGTLRSWSPLVDDLTFGSRPIPEPTIPTLFLVALAARVWRGNRSSA